jgi:hypothetical protein
MQKALLNLHRLYVKAKAQGYGVLGLFVLGYKLVQNEIEYEENLERLMDERADNEGVLEQHKDRWEEWV